MLAQLSADRFAIVNPGAGWGAKCWPAESFGTVARTLQEKEAWRWSSITALARKRLPRQSANRAVELLLPVKCSVGELISLTRRASLFIGGDTGPMHLAAALHVPVVALFGPTRPERNGPYGTSSIVLRNPESADNSSHTDRPDEGLTGDSAASGDRGSRRVAGRPRWLTRSLSPPGPGAALRAEFGFRWDFCLPLSTSGGRKPTWSSILAGVLIAMCRPGHSRACIRAGEERSRADDHRALRLRAQSALPRLNSPRRWFRTRGARSLDRCFPGRLLRADLRSRHSGRAELSAQSVSRLTPITSRRVPSLVPRTLWFAGVTNGFSRELYFRHREYNSLLGAAAIVVVLIAKIFLFPG